MAGCKMHPMVTVGQNGLERGECVAAKLAGIFWQARVILCDRAPSLQGHFSHDRIQQAAYSLFSEEQRQDLHARMGRMLLIETLQTDQERDPFHLVYHLNQGGFSHGNDRELKRRIALLNYRAGHRARLSAAHSASLAFFEAGIRHLEADAWSEDYDATLTDRVSECSDLITEADQNLYRAKGRGRNCVIAEAGD